MCKKIKKLQIFLRKNVEKFVEIGYNIEETEQ
jgi:hypothetical protein